MIARDRDDLDARWDRAVLYQEVGEHRRALAAFDVIAEARPADGEARARAAAPAPDAPPRAAPPREPAWRCRAPRGGCARHVRPRLSRAPERAFDTAPSWPSCGWTMQGSRSRVQVRPQLVLSRRRWFKVQSTC